MRQIREVTAEAEKCKLEKNCVRCDPVQPEPIGTIVLFPFKITGYDRDCDGSLMAKLEHVDTNQTATGWSVNCIGLYPDSGFVVAEKELRELQSKTQVSLTNKL